MPPPSRSVPLVGREAVLQVMWARVAASAEGGMQVAVIRGPAGSGKTRVLDAFAGRARAAGATVLPGRSAVVGGPPYAALSDALGAYVRSSPPAAGQVRRAGDALVALVPALAVDGGSVPRPDSLGVVQALYRLVQQVTERRPLVLVVDDAHIADGETCEALAAVARHAADLPWTLALGWRDPADDVSQDARRLLEQLRRERDPLETVLDPLDRGAAAELVAALLGEGLPASGLVDMVHARTAGNPYHLEELVRWLRHSGRLRRAGLQWTAAPGSEDELPPTVEEAIRERTAALDPLARAVLEWLAVAGGTLDLSVLAGVSGLGDAELAASLDTLVRAGMVVEREGRTASFTIRHPLAVESVYREVGLARRRLAHRALARAAADRGAGAQAVADHLVRAADPGDADAMRALLAAGEEAEAGLHISRAVAWYQAALELAASPDDELRLQALERLSECAAHAGRLAAGVSAVEELLARAEPGDELRRLTLLRRLATLRVVGGDTARAREAIEEGLRLAAAGGAEAALLLAELAMVAQMTLPLPEQLEVVARGRAVARAAGAVAPEIICRAFEAIATSDMGDPDAGAELATAAAADALDAVEPLAFGYALFAVSVCDMSRGRFRDVVTRLDGLVVVVEEAGLLWAAAWAHTLIGQVRWISGEFAESVAAYSRADELARRAQGPNVMPMPVIGLATVLAAQGRRDAAVERLAEARAWLDERRVSFYEPWYWHAAGMTAELDGDMVAAVDNYRRMVDVLEERGALAQLPMRARLVRALALAGEAGEACRLGQAFLDRLQGRRLPFGEVALQMALSVALRSAGRAEEALAVAERALAGSEAVDGDWLATTVRMALGEALLAAGNRERARGVLLDAHTAMASIGMEPERAHVAGVLASLGVTVRAQAPDPPRAGDLASSSRDGPLRDLTPREREIAELASTGASSRSIALRLTLSERTVENHLQHVYAKLGLHGRAELIALVAGTFA
jgi:DNA-binding CsgD family transcriptional regulator/tetratricopeptide (TPR) repeat protein